MRAVISRARARRAMTSGEVTVETGKSQFIFYPPIFVYNLLISDSWSSLLLLPFLDVGPWAYSTIHGPRRLFVKARAGPGLSPTAWEIFKNRVTHGRTSADQKQEPVQMDIVPRHW